MAQYVWAKAAGGGSRFAAQERAVRQCWPEVGGPGVRGPASQDSAKGGPEGNPFLLG